MATVTLSPKYQIVIPQDVRQSLGLRPGQRFDVFQEDGQILFVPVVGGLYVKRAGAPEALASMAAGMVTLLLVTYGTSAGGFGLLNANILGLSAAALAFFGVMLVRRQESS